MLSSKRLILAHFWLAFAVFGLAILLGAWQMWVRSPFSGWISDPECGSDRFGYLHSGSPAFCAAETASIDW